MSFAAIGGGDISPELCGQVRSAADADADADENENDFVVRVADTPARADPSHSPTKTQATGRRKHKSRMAHLQPMATPNPRRALGARNFAAAVYQTPAPAKARPDGMKAVPNTMPVLPRSDVSGGDEHASTAGASPTPVVLVLDQAVQALPWESSFLMR